MSEPFEIPELHTAALDGHLEKARRAIENGADIDALDPSGDTALHCACWRRDIEMVKLLVSSGANINAFHDFGHTALQDACRDGDIEIVNLLLSCGADVNANDESHIGETPLGQVAKECSFELAKILIDAGANPKIKGWMQLTALHRSEQRKDDEGIRVHKLLVKAAKRFRD